jgi:hypothetical protein
MNKLKLLPMLSLLFLAGCFPIELDVKDGKLLIAREEGYFLFDPATSKTKKICGAEDGKPVIARFSPDGKEILTVFKPAMGFGEFKFVIRPIDGGKGREVFKGPDCAFVRYSPDGASLAIVRMSKDQDKEFKSQVPELYLVPTKGGDSKLLARKTGVLFRWFADSKRLLIFEIQKKADFGNYLGSLSVLDVAGGKTTPLASLAVPQMFHFDLSPDNKKVLFTAYRADKAGADLGKVMEFATNLFELDVAKGTVRKTDKQATYAIYSPNGKQVLLGTPPQGFNFDSLKLEVADADVAKSTVVAPNASAPGLGGGGTVFPGWVDDKTVFYFVSKAVYGTEGKSLMLMTAGVDGKGKKCVQPAIEMEILKDEK